MMLGPLMSHLSAENPRNARREVGRHPRWDAGTIHSRSHAWSTVLPAYGHEYHSVAETNSEPGVTSFKKCIS